MTTSVKIEAHCASNKEVVVTTFEQGYAQTQILKDGEHTIVYAYDNRQITVLERETRS